jgi:hypothetical protein
MLVSVITILNNVPPPVVSQNLFFHINQYIESFASTRWTPVPASR